ncbi:hypothetical protein BDN72DRAFT_841164 [Pluteus cervinus]|uniref:Uncharacterized protein n=1 Tax=Pluteus cervinus TaxID=181527 RepID=A0ACD3ATR8_9AGAR|nr:hypothetical protein BDN72DRAFT_841164 [Pluteus cervinus]
MEHIMDIPSIRADEIPEIVEGANNGSVKELSMLAKTWVSLKLPDAMRPAMLTIFLYHLNSPKVPTKPKTEALGILDGIDEERAFWSLWALAQLAEFFCQPSLDVGPYLPVLIRAWPSIFKWSAFFFTSRVQGSSTNNNTKTASLPGISTRGTIRDVIAASWCSLAILKATRETMLETRGVVDIVARLWTFEDDLDDTRFTPFGDGAPTALLVDLLSREGSRESLNSIISAAGGDTGRIAQISLCLLKKTFRSSEFTSNPSDTVVVFHLITRLCFSEPKVLDAFLDHDVIPACIELLLRLAPFSNKQSCGTKLQAEFIKLMIFAFQLLRHSTMNTIGLPWVLQVIKSGFLHAFVECSPFYDDLQHDDYIFISATVTNVIPRYLVYYSVVQAMDTMLHKLKRTKGFLALRNTRAWEAFNDLALLTAQRLQVVGFKRLRKEATRCRNPKCIKTSDQNDFRKCARCLSALYCSTECQRTHWKDHKRRCKQPTKEPQGAGSISQRDWEYIQSLNVCETRYNLPHLKRLAAAKHAGVPYHDLVVVINYNTMPMTFRVDLHSLWLQKRPELFDSPGIRHYVGALTGFPVYILGLVPYDGRGLPRLYPTPFDSEIWDWDETPVTKDGKEAGLDPTGNRIVDWMDEEAEVRRKLYCGV